jgi:hypothetical protein
MIHEGDEESDDIDEGNTVELERDDEEISSNDGNEEENGKDEILCDNVKSMIQADQIVCDRRMVNTVTLYVLFLSVSLSLTSTIFTDIDIYTYTERD